MYHYNFLSALLIAPLDQIARKKAASWQEVELSQTWLGPLASRHDIGLAVDIVAAYSAAWFAASAGTSAAADECPVEGLELDEAQHCHNLAHM